MTRRYALLLFVLAVPAAGQAKVVSASHGAFEIEHRISVAAPPGATYGAIRRIDGWWSKDHTYSGDAANLSLELTPGGCFCEKMAGGGGIEHMRVALVQPGEQVLLTGALGPLLYEAVAGVMVLRVEKSGGGSVLVLNYRATGFVNGDADKLAPVVDKVLGEQAQGLARYAAGPR